MEGLKQCHSEPYYCQVSVSAKPLKVSGEESLSTLTEILRAKNNCHPQNDVMVHEPIKFIYKRQGKFALSKLVKILLTSLPTNLLTPVKNLVPYYPSALVPSKKFAFTLAEVLITLGIIGVVAAMTMPALIQKHQDKELIVRTKKVYSDMQNAALLGQNEYGTPGNNFSLFDPAKGSYAVAKNYAKHFSGAKVCQNAQAAGCTQYNYTLKRATNYQNSDGSYGYVGFGSNPIIILNNGAVMGIQMVPNCQQEIVDYERDENGDLKLDENGNAISSIQIQNFCADIRFDVNGPKNPNQFGRDAYSIMVGKDKLYPNSTGHLGAASLLNILTGKDELIYENTKVGN